MVGKFILGLLIGASLLGGTQASAHELETQAVKIEKRADIPRIETEAMKPEELWNGNRPELRKASGYRSQRINSKLAIGSILLTVGAVTYAFRPQKEQGGES